MRVALFLCAVVFVLALVRAEKPKGSSVISSNVCGRHGDPCTSDSQCCSGTKCHRYAGRCQVQITAEMLQEAKAKLKHVPPPREG